ncbi:MAG: hypothetical protein V3U60_11090 [Gammaproteobacteria bacterium]
MTAGIFAGHGVWIGTCRQGASWNAKGFFENKKIKKLIVAEHRAIVNKCILATKKPGFRAKIEQAIANDHYPGGPWLWKGSALYWPAFFEFEPKFVVVNRPREQIFHSTRASGMLSQSLSDDALYANIDFHKEQMDYLVTFKQAVRVNTAELISGDFSSIRKAIEHCGLTYSETITADFVEPKLWHF